MSTKWATTLLTYCLMLLAVGQVHATDPEPSTGDPLPTESDKLSYALGLEIGASLKELGEHIVLDAFVRGLGDRMEENELLLTPQQAHEIKKKVFAEIQKKRAEQMAGQAQKNGEEGEAFLSKNKDAEGVVATASGLQYTVLRDGDGRKPGPDDRVKVHYRGTLLDGTEFDSSYERGEPTTFPLGGVIAGWTEALQLMDVGSHYRLFIPPNLAYGQTGAGTKIGPNATLVFEVELLEIVK